MKASPTIYVKRLSITHTLGVRFSAYVETHQNGKKIRSHIHAISEEFNWSGDDGYWHAAIGLCVKAGFSGVLQGAYTVDGMVFVFRDNSQSKLVPARRRKETDESWQKRMTHFSGVA